MGALTRLFDARRSRGPRGRGRVPARRRREAVATRFERLDGRAMLAPVAITGAGSYAQNFNGLISSGSGTWTNDTTLAAWYAQRSGTGTSIAADTGSGTGGNLYSYGSTSSTDRAIGSIGSSNAAAGSFAWGVLLKNDSGLVATIGTISYVGEQWRSGGLTSGVNTITFWYRTGVDPITSLTPTSDTGWTAVTALDFSSPINNAAAAALDGNAAANRVAKSANAAIVVPVGQYVMLRWRDPDHSGTDHGLAIDDVNVAFTVAAATAPAVGSPTSGSVTATGVTLGGTVTSDGGANVTERGIVYAINADNAAPEIGGTGVTKVAAAAGGTGVFTVPVTGLAGGTLYAFKAYATNSAGTTYSDVAAFTTDTLVVAPTVTSPTSASILDVQALLGGTVASDGGAAVTERGIVISLTSENGAPEIGGPGVTTVIADAAGTGTFTKLVTGLTAASGYTFRAYATNSAGTSYSDPATFSTTAAATAPVVATPTKSQIGSTTATLGGSVTADGGRPVTERGIVYAKTADNADPTIDGTGVTKVVGTLGIGTGTFTVAVTGLEALTGYTFKAYATNGVGTSYTALDTFTTFATETSLTAGDIAFTGYQTDDPDGYSFVLLKDVVAGTTITVTDNGWAFDQSGFTNTTENTQIVQFGSAYPSGTHFQIAGGGTPTFTVIGSGAGAGTLSGVISGFSTSGDSLLAYQGTVPTSGSAANWIAGVNSKAWATATFTNTNDSALPTALTNGITAIGFTSEEDNGAYNKATFTGTPAQVRADVNNTANWTRASTSGSGSSTVFTVQDPVATTATLSVTPVTAAFGQSVTFAGSVTAATGTAQPTGTVEIRDGGAAGTLLAQGTITAGDPGTGTFSLASTTVPAGTYTDVRAYYLPTGVFVTSTSAASALTVEVVGAATTTSLTGITPLSSTFGTSVTITGTVVAATGSLTPVGTVEIRDGGPTGRLLASTGTITGSDATGSFTIVTSAVPIGSYASVRAYFKATSQVDFLDSQSDAFGGGTLTVSAAPFTPGNLLVLRVGNGTTVIDSNVNDYAGAVTLLEFTPSGTLVQAIPVSASGASALTLRANSTTEGTLGLSADRQSVTFGGFRVDTGATNPNTGTADRVIGKVSPTGSVDTAQGIVGAYGGVSIRSVVTDDGTNFWLSGAAGTNGGLRIVSGGSSTTSTALVTAATNTRQVQIFDGNLFLASSTAPANGLYQVGAGLPTSVPQTVTSLGIPSAGESFQSAFYADLSPAVSWNATGYDTVYVTDSAGFGTAVKKYSYVVTAGSGSWTASGSVAVAGAASVAGYAGVDGVTLFVTSSTASTGSFTSVVDTTGYNADFSGSAVSTLSTAGTNYAFRGVSFVPRSGVATTTTITGITPTTAEQAESVTFTATVAAGSGSARPTGSVQFRSGAVLLATATIADGADATTGLATVTVPMTAIPLGTYSVTAQYIPDGNPSLNVFNPGTSAAFGTPLVIQAPGVVTTTTLASVTWAAQPAAAGYGDPITFAGRVETADTSTPVGTVEIRNGGPTGTLLGSTTTFATDGSYTIVTSTPIASGTYANLAAHFIGGTGFKGSSSSGSATTLQISSTALTAGDIAFTGLKVEGTPEKISFVLLKDILAGTTLVITDNAWTGTALATNEGSSTITFTQAFAAGTEFDFDSTRTAGSRWQAGGSGTGLSDVTTSPPALGNGGDNVFAYQGVAPTTGSAAGWIAAISTQAFITTGTASTVTTYLPTALALGDTAFALGLTNASLSQDAWLNDLGTVTNTAAGIRATVYTLSNWSAGLDPATSVPVVPSATIFVLGSPSLPTIGTTGTLSAVSTTYGEASTTTSITVTGSGLTADVTATAPAGFQVSSDGTTFSTTATFAQVGGAASGTLYVRLAATTAAGTYSGDVTLASTGATGVNAAMPSSTVGTKSLTITGLTAVDKEYDGTPAATLSGTAAYAGLANGESFAVAGSPTAAFADPGAGTGKTVSVSGFTAPSDNYSVTQPTTTAAITKKTLTVTAGDASRLLDEADPAFTATITGFANGETEAVVAGAASLSTTATGSSPAGTYPITAAAGTLAAANYDFSFVPGTLTIGDELVFDVAAAQTVTYSTARSAALKVIKRGPGTLVLDAASAHTGQTTVEAGTIVVAHGDALAASPVRVVAGATLKVNAALTMRSPTVTIAGGTLDGTGATLLVNATTGIGTLAITSGAVTGSPQLTVSGNGVVTLPTDRQQIIGLARLTIDQAGGGRIDIGKGRINVAVGGTTEAELRADLIAGRNGNAFNGTSGIMTTGGKASTGSQFPVVGYRILTSGAAIVAWAAYGDTNLDGQVSPTDTSLINQGGKFGKGTSTGSTWAQGDFNYSGGVTPTDISLVNSAGLFGKGSYLPVAPAGAQAGSTSPTGTLPISEGAWIAFAIDSQTQTTTQTTTKKKL